MSPFPSLPTEQAPSNTAFEIGWDFAHHRLVPPAEHLMPGNPVRSGWEAGKAAFGQRTLRVTPHIRKWLQLRLGAWVRGKAFEGVQVTPAFLERIDVTRCPITGQALTRGTGADTDASVDRVNNHAGYAAGNLAVMSVRANQAKSAYGWGDAATFVRHIEAGQLGQIDGLNAREWARLAALMSYCTPLSHEEAANLPLLVLPPPRLRLLNPVQAVQAGLTLCFAQVGKAPRLDALVRIFPSGIQREVRYFLAALQARRVAAGPAATAGALRAALEAAWSQPVLMRLWRRVALRLNQAHFESVAAALPAAAGGLAPFRYLSLEQATEGWALETGGMAVPEGWPEGQASNPVGGALTPPAWRTGEGGPRGRRRPERGNVPLARFLSE
ncbi:MAG: hypothetical protein LW854_20105 [Rubrivivax sp.]|jgi:hypothetical protein|nr:hypothetical protein [Rubrivivax sp.]